MKNFIFAVALLLCGGLQAATVTVNPPSSIQTAINAATAGDTIIVGAGDFTGGITVNKAITVIGNVGAKLNASTPGSGTGVTIASNNCLVQGLYLNGFATAIAPSNAGNNGNISTPTGVTIKNNHTYNCQFHIWIEGTQWLVQGNNFEKVRWWSGTGDADYGRVFGTGHIIRGNYFHGSNFSDTSLAPASGADYAHVDGLQYYGSNGEVLKSTTIDYNFFTDFLQGLFLCDEAAGSLNTLIIQHNVFWGQTTAVPAPGSNNYGTRPSWGIVTGKNVGATSMTVKNNIVYNVNNALGIRASSSGVWTKNVIYGLSAGTAYDPSTTTPSLVTIDNYRYGMSSVGQTGYVGTDLTANPLLANTADPIGADGLIMTADDGWRTTLSGALLYGPQLQAAPAPPPPVEPPVVVPPAAIMEWRRVRVYNTNGTLAGYRWAQVTTTDVSP